MQTQATMNLDEMTTIHQNAVPTVGPSSESASVSSMDGDETVKQLTVIWQQLLGVEPITADQNYFELGGDSILAVQLFAQIEREFHLKLPVATLFEAPTIAALAGLIRRDAPASGWSPLVPIQTAGSRPPFFCIHGAGGNVLIYRELSKQLGADQPFFGLQSQGLDGNLPILQTVEEMASLYVEEIRRVRPYGPYLVGGYCGGGTIALEVAQQLHALGKDIALLALFDTCNWCKIPPFSIWSKTYHHSERVVFHALSFLGLDSAGRSQLFREKVREVRHRLPVWRGMLQARVTRRRDADSSASRLLGEIWKANDEACSAYIPKPYFGIITDFRPKRQYRIFNKPDAKWDHLAHGGQDVVSLPVYPAVMLVEPFVQQLASALRARIDRVIGLQGLQAAA
jgi:phthiocerol/phenolphthiocerol synthesis type-I polyketide synthase E